MTYGEVFLENEKQFSAYNFETANTETLFRWFKDAAEENARCIEAKLPLPAYDQAIKASHIFNTLQARGVISVAERQAYIGRVRDLAKGACQSWMEKNGWDGMRAGPQSILPAIRGEGDRSEVAVEGIFERSAHALRHALRMVPLPVQLPGRRLDA